MTAARPAVRELTVDEAVARARRGARVIDVREPAEWDTGHIAGAVHVPLGELPERIGGIAPDPGEALLLVCEVGARSARAAAWLADRGYTNVATMSAALRGWRAAGGAWESPPTDEGGSRYARQVMLPEIGALGQERLEAARIVLVGAGGLGSPVALYLAAAGIGTLSIIDHDTVEESNLARQVLHATDALGRPKVDSAAETLAALNPEPRIETHRERLGPANVDRLIERADVVVDGTDNLETRYVLNDAAVRLRIPVVHGSIHRWQGQITTFIPHAGPCLRCLHPSPPPPELAPDCAVAGVVGVLPGLVGVLQAAEAVKLVLDAGQPLVGRLLLVDALTAEFTEVRVARDPACPSCGEPGPWTNASA